MSDLRESVRHVLTADWFYRKQQAWPLLVLDDSIPIANKIFGEFELLDTILKRHKGKLAACGGAT